MLILRFIHHTVSQRSLNRILSEQFIKNDVFNFYDGKLERKFETLHFPYEEAAVTSKDFVAMQDSSHLIF